MMKKFVIFSGLVFIFSLSSYAEGIKFPGFSDLKSAQEVCLQTTEAGEYLQVKSVYQAISELKNTSPDTHISLNCQWIIDVENGSPIEELNIVCESIKQENENYNINVSKVVAFNYSEFLDDNNITNCAQTN